MEAVGVLSHMLLGGLAASAALYTIGADLLASGEPGTVRRGPAHRRAVALTFDDGPDPVFTPRILDVLAQFGVRATFFVIGKQAEQHPTIIRAIANAGHDVGNHSYGHRPLWMLPPHQTRMEIDRGAQVLTTILGEPPRYFRPPWGRFNLAATRHSTRVGQQRVLWSLRPEGWLPLAGPETIVRNVDRRLHPGAIIDLHDGGGLRGTPARTTAALPAILRLLSAREYRCLNLSDLLSEASIPTGPATQPSRLWEWYEWAWHAWHGVERIGQEAILALGAAIYDGPDLTLRDGTMISAGAQVGELHLDRAQVARLHRTVASHRLGLALRRELESTLQLLARMVVERPGYHGLQAFRSTTLFWKVATRLGFEVSPRRGSWHLGFLSWYQQQLLARDHPLGRRRLQGKHWEARTIWLSRQALLQHYGEGGNERRRGRVSS